MLAFLIWWGIIQIFGLAALPLAWRVFAWLPDQGYAFSKTVGLLLVSYLLWLGASTGILTNTSGGILLALLLLAGLSVWLGIRRGGFLASLRDFWKEHKGQVLIVELLFLLAFAGWTLVRAYAPDKIMSASGEKYMEIAFLNGVLNSPRFPPLDPWMAGYGISYYYFGYVMMGIMARFSGVAPTISFDLYDALTFALTAVTAYGVVSSLVRAARGSKASAKAFGLLGALFIVGMGNLEGLLEGLYSAGLLPDSFWQWIDIPDLLGSAQSGSFFPGDNWWWWRASRVLHDLNLSGKPVLYQPIDEFPFFSFLLGDNHPHKLALPFVLLVVGLAFNLLLRQRSLAGAKEATSPSDAGPSPRRVAWQRFHGWARPRREAIGLSLFYALALGSLLFLNTWDFPICLGLVVLAYGGGQVLSGEPIGVRLAGQALLLGIGLTAGAVLLYIFFFFSFASQAGGILPYAFQPTRLPQYLVMFGPFIFILAFFVTGAARRAHGGRFPFVTALKAWAWIAGLCFSILLVLLLAALLVISRSGLENSPYIQNWLNGLSLWDGARLALRARIDNPWLFLLLSAMLAVIVAAVFPKDGRGQADSYGGRPPELAESEFRPHPTDNDGTGSAQDATIHQNDYENSPGPIESPDRSATLFALLVAFAGLALTLVVEFVYLRDNFGMRMNTIFKFYYQGWVLMACASAYGAWWVINYGRAWARAIFAIGAVLLIAGSLVYPVMGILSRDESFQSPPNLDAAATFAGEYPGRWAAHPDDWAAIQWLRQNWRQHGRSADGSVPRILEAVSLGYENAGRISAFTGFPTILGWTNHEGQWRGNDVEVYRRMPVVETIYTTASGSTALELLHKWKVRYVIIGDTERVYISKLCQDPANACKTPLALAKFDKILTKVFSQGGTRVYEVPGP